MKAQIEPKILKGFRDFLPAQELVRKEIIRRLEAVFESFGFVPIDTPAIEYAEILLGKSGGETEKQVYHFKDQGEREVALRFDLTVPFARFLAQHRHELTMPFKRYHIAKVWRGEKPHAGRYREFIQCDFDIVGVDNASADFEIMLVMCRSLQKQNLTDFRIHFSHRGLINDFLKKHRLDTDPLEVMRLLDKAKKIPPAELQAELVMLCGKDLAEELTTFIQPLPSSHAKLEQLAHLLGPDNSHLARIREIFQLILSLDLETYFILDTSITRGLDYYTGVVFESFICGSEHLGSVCSGGRYANLVGLYTPENISGVGASVGLDRLLTILESRNSLSQTKGRLVVAIPIIDEELIPYYHKLAETIRATGLGVEVFHTRQKLASQFTLAEKKGIRFAILVGGQELKGNVFHIRDLSQRLNYENLTQEEMITKLKELAKETNHEKREL